RREFEGTHVLELRLRGSCGYEYGYDQQKGTYTIHRSLLAEKTKHTAPRVSGDGVKV
ncbi:uncharacterized protein METZ01_LOCUS383124, partial [marine metagenome]